MTIQALYALYQEAFIGQHPRVIFRLTAATDKLCQAFCGDGNIKAAAYANFVNELQALNISDKMNKFDKLNKGRPLFIVCLLYTSPSPRD